MKAWFDEGKIKEAILGEGDYFIMDHTYRSEHDLITVLSTLDTWITTDEKQAQASIAFYDSLNEIWMTGKLQQLWA